MDKASYLLRVRIYASILNLTISLNQYCNKRGVHIRDDCGALRAFWDDGIADVYYGEAINTTIGTWVPLFAGRNQDDIFNAHTKKAHSIEWAFLLIGSLAVFYSHMGKPHTTIDANVFHF